MLGSDHLLRGYEFFYQKKYSRENFALTVTDQIKKEIYTCLAFLDKRVGLESLGPKFLWKYLVFQLNYWDELTITNYNKKLNLSFFLGRKALLRYFDRATAFDWTLYYSAVVSKYELRYSDFLIYCELQKKEVESRPAKVSIRTKLHNTPEGLVACIQHTTLYDPKDNACLTCKYSKECKEILRVNYPKIYNKRRLNHG